MDVLYDIRCPIKFHGILVTFSGFLERVWPVHLGNVLLWFERIWQSSLLSEGLYQC